MFTIGSIPIEGSVFLSPMAGISDSPYRLLCRQMGAGFSFTEFVSAEALRAGSRRALDLLRFVPAERPVVFQIFGHREESILEAARIARELEPDVLDLNMGCSCSRVANKGGGAGLLLDLRKAGRMIEALRTTLDIPVTAKIRIGWDDRTLNYLDTARMLHDAGAQMISVHGRTKQQAYTGRAAWEPIGEIKARVSVPVLGNGDVRSYAEAMARKQEFGLDGVLIGRGAIGNPWVFSAESEQTRAPVDIVGVALRHLRAMDSHYKDAPVLFRKHAARYFNGFVGAAELRALTVRASSVAQFEDHCQSFLAQNPMESAA